METLPHYYDIEEFFVTAALKFHHEQFVKGEMVFHSYDEQLEKKYRKKMAKACARILEYYGVKVETKFSKAKGKDSSAVGSKADSATLP